ncbi:MAG: SpoIIE family protein phosphatase [Bdellovibrionaceae bacterium]|nr:SpoIIE family protein phosphatase [Pseudobdellovibrionaceae bacterium]MBX3033337.1 SpoIIE family protein phosphatase [Pseudobdellovibrionaceae bacterium]
MKRRGISLRYKILILLTTIPVLTLAAYLVLAMRVFESDKIAYVFDSTSNMSGTLATQVKTQLNSVLITCKPIFQDYFSTFSRTGQRAFSPAAGVSLQQEPLIGAVAAYRVKEDGGFEQTSLVEREPGLWSRILESQRATISADFGLAQKQGRLLRAPFGDDRVLLFEKFETGQETTIFAVVTSLSEISEMFKTAMSQQMYLIDRSGSILFGPQDTGVRNLRDLMSLSILADPGKKVVQGAETSNGADGRPLLVSYSNAGFGDLIVVSTVSREKALSAVSMLLRKSLIFFVILICLTVVISLIASGTITRALTSLFAATQKVSEGQFDIRVDVTSNDEVGALADNFNVMAAEVSRLLEQTAEKARMESELQTAKTVQETLFPETRSRLPGLEIAGFYEPASECGGDWWHYCEVGQRVFLWIGDATGHGAPAALITSAAKSAATIIESMNVNPAQAMTFLNKAICEVSRGRIMMTFFLAAFDRRTQTLTYANASHEAPFLIRRGESELKKRDLIPLNEVNSPRLGQAKDTEYQETSVQLQPGDMIFFYTDGVPDVRSPGNEAWGEREFIRTLVSVYKDFPSAEDSVERFVGTFQSFRQGSQLADDVTFFVIKNEESGGV